MMSSAERPSRAAARGSGRRIALAVSETAGHFYPALAVAEAFQAADPGCQILFISDLASPAARLAPRHGYAFGAVPGTPFAGAGPLGKALALARIALATVHASKLLKRHRAELVIGFGGYASAGVLVAARALGLQTAVHEANQRPGLTNRVCARFVHRVYLSSPAAESRLGGCRPFVTGHPVRASIVAAGRRTSAPPSTGRPARVLVTSASRGAGFFAERVPEMLAQVTRRGIALEVQHQAGEADLAALAQAYERDGMDARVVPYIDDMAEAYAWADMAVTRAGAGTLAELALVGRPALLVPLVDSAEDHQTANARAFAEAGAAVWTSEPEWKGALLAERIARLVTDASAWMAASRAARALATPQAAARIVSDCEELVAR
jgi:UDP-N-acetylglucosamine--N-acetylmuramyl-(pentapeptide) pyrophosphoryl-undecaprenol N-acetylglucosamine transferase